MKKTHDLINESFRNLKKTAQSAADIEAWFMENPRALIGDLIIPLGAEVKVVLELEKDDVFAYALTDEKVHSLLTFEIYYELPTTLPLATNFHTNSGVRVIDLKHTAELSLYLDDWPFATAFVADVCTRKHSHWSEYKEYPNLYKKVDQFLAEHFPGWTMEKLLGLAELLPLDTKGELSTGAVQNILFESNTPKATAEVPYNIL